MTWEMVGHAWAVDLLRRHVANGQVRHAYLFTGPEGVGKRTLALRFAQALNCLAPPAPGERCGLCRACRRFGEATHPDLHLVTRQEGESQISIDTVRELEHQLALAPYEARWRVALLARFHEASLPAQNALLKTLEEPPPKVVLLLTAQTAESLLPTIASRCERLALRGLTAAEIEADLRGRGEPTERARLLSALAAGRPGVALKLVADSEWMERRSEHLDQLQALLGASRLERFAYVDDQVGKKHGGDLEAKRRATAELLQTWLGMWRDALLLASGAQATLANPDRAQEAEHLAAKLDPADLTAAIQATERTLEAARRNVNLQLALETLMLDWPRLGSLPAA